MGREELEGEVSGGGGVLDGEGCDGGGRGGAFDSGEV